MAQGDSPLCEQEGQGPCRWTRVGDPSRWASQGWASSLPPWSSLKNLLATRSPQICRDLCPLQDETGLGGLHGLPGAWPPPPHSVGSGHPWLSERPVLTHRDFPASVPSPALPLPPAPAQLPGAPGPQEPHLPDKAFPMTPVVTDGTGSHHRHSRHSVTLGPAGHPGLATFPDCGW